MLAADRDAVICDFAETYRIVDIHSLPATTAATLACGLGESSRIMRKLSGTQITLDQQLQAITADNLRLLVWAQTKDGQNNRNRPESLYAVLTTEKQASDEPMVFNSGEDFNAARQRIIEGT